MKSSSRKDLTVFDFKEEDEITESVSGRFVGRFRNLEDENSAITKYHFLECFAQGIDVQRVEISKASCVDVDESDSSHKCDDCGSHALGTLGECAIKQGISCLDAVLISKSMSNQSDTHNSSGNHDPRSLFHGGNSLAIEALRSGVPSATLLDPSSDNESVDVISDDDKSARASSPLTPDFSENEGEPTSDHCYGGWETDHIHTAVVVSPDFVLYGDAYCTESLLTFFGNCIKLDVSFACGKKENFICEWAIGDVIDIKSQWCGTAETVLVRLCLKPTDAVGAENAHGNSGGSDQGSPIDGMVKLTFGVCDPKWSEKQEKITSLHARYKDKWNVVLDTEMAMGTDDPMGQGGIFFPKHYFSNFDETFEDVIYPKGDPDAVSISKRDVELLQPETFINDTIIDFYIKYLKNKIPPEDKHRFHFFNSFFFRKLADLDRDPSSASEGRAAFQRVRKWTRKVNLFEKDYVFIPVNFNLHWSLIVICHPGEVVNFKDEEIDKSLKVPCILHMDSIKGSHKCLKNLVQSYLWEEWKERQKESLDDVSSKFFNMRFVPLELPQQENSFDCGLFLLHYVEMFLEEAPVEFSPFKITKFSNFLTMDWFPPAEPSLKRTLIQKLIYEILEDHSQKVLPAACGDEHHSSEFPENNYEKENGIEFLSENCRQEKTCHGNSCSTAEQGIEIELLARSPPGGAQCSRDSGLVLMEFFNPGATDGSFHDGQYRPFDQMTSFQRFKPATSPIEEDSETGEQFVYSPSGEAGCQPGVTDEACTTSSYSPKDFEAMDIFLNPRISTRVAEHVDGDSSPDPSGCGSPNLPGFGVEEHFPNMDVVCPNQQEETQKVRSASPENIGCVTESPASASGGKLETLIVEDSQEGDRMANGKSEDSLSSSQENPVSSSLQEANFTKNIVNVHVQLSDDDPASEPFEQQAAKRPRLTLPLEEER